MKKHSRLMKLSAAGLTAAMVMTGAVPNVPVIGKLDTSVVAYAAEYTDGQNVAGTAVQVGDTFYKGSAIQQAGDQGWDMAIYIDDALAGYAGSWGGRYTMPCDAKVVAGGTSFKLETLPSVTTDLSSATVNVDVNNKSVSVNASGRSISSTRYTVKYGATEENATSEFPTEPGSYYAFITANTDTYSNYVGSAQSAAFTVTATNTVTWTDISANKAQDGISITSSNIDFEGDKISGSGSITFTSNVGKIKKIEISGDNVMTFDTSSGWYESGGTSLVWNGTAADSVILSAFYLAVCDLSQIVYTLEAKSDISDATVTVDTDNQKVTVTRGNAFISEDEYTVKYGTDAENAALTAFPTDSGTYVAVVTAKSDSTYYTGTAASAAFTIGADKTALEKAITDAQEYYDRIGNEYPDISAALKTAINTAQTVYNNSGATQKQTDDAKTALDTAVQKAKDDVQLVKNKAEFNEYKTASKTTADSKAKGGDNETSQNLITNAKAEIDALAYNEDKTLAENKAAVDAILSTLDTDLAAQRAADKAAFEQHKTNAKDTADSKANDGDSQASQNLIANAKAAIDALTYDEEKSLDENKAAVDAILEQLETDLAAQREADRKSVNDVITKIKNIGTVEYTPECKEKITAARTAYDALDDVLKEEVVNYSALDYAEKLYANLKEKTEAEFEEYKTNAKTTADSKAEDGDSEASQNLITNAKAAIDAVTYNEDKTLAENRAAVDEILTNLDTDLAAQRAADELAANKAAFEEYKTNAKTTAGNKAKDGDSEASQSLITNAREAIDNLIYDEGKSLDDNKADVDEILSKLDIDLEAQRAADKLAQDKAEFENYKANAKTTADSKAKGGDNQTSQNLIASAKETIDTLPYNENKSLDENKAAVDEILTKLDTDLAAQRASDNAAFEQHRTTSKTAADNKAKNGDSAASKNLITNAKAAIDAITYDDEKSLDENKAAVDAILEQLEQDLAAQREADNQSVNDVIAKIKAIGTVEYTEASKAKIDTARNAYDALDDALKENVTNYIGLPYAEQLYDTLKAKSETDDELAEAVAAKQEADAKAAAAETAKNEALAAKAEADAAKQAALEAKAEAEAAKQAAEDNAEAQKAAAEAAKTAQQAAEAEADAQKAAADAATAAADAATAEANAQKAAADAATAAKEAAEARVAELEEDAEANAEELAAAREEVATQRANAEAALAAQQNAESEAAAQKEAAAKALEAQQKAEEEAAKQKEAAEKAIAEKDEAVAAKEAAEAAQKEAEEKAAKAEEAKNAAETAQKTAEEKAKQAEKAKADAEAAQKAAEDDAAKQKEAAEAAAKAQKAAEDEAEAQKDAAKKAAEAQQAAEDEAKAQKDAADKAAKAQAEAEAKVKELEKDAETNAEELAAAKEEVATQKANAEKALEAQQNAEAEAAAQKANADKALEAQKAAEAEAAAQKEAAEKALAAQKAAEEKASQAEADAEAQTQQLFDDYKTSANAAIDAIGKYSAGSEAVNKLVEDAKAAVNSVAYDKTKSFAENKAAVDEIVNKAAADIAAQEEAERPVEVKANVVNENGIMFTAGIDSLNYKEVGFIFEVNGKEVRRSTNTVYSSIDGSEYGTSDFENAGYVYSFTIEDIADSGTEIKVTPYSIDLNGKETRGETETYSLAQLSAGGEVVPMSVDKNADTEDSGAIALYGTGTDTEENVDKNADEENAPVEEEETADEPDKEEAVVTDTEIVEVEEVLD